VNGGLSTRSNVGWTLAGRIVYGASQAGLLVLLAKLGTVRMVGQFALALAVTAPVMVFASLQLRNLYATDVTGSATWSSYRALRGWGSAVGLAAVVAIAACGSFAPDVAAAIVLVGVAKTVEAQQDFAYGVFQRFGRMDCFGQSLVLRGALGLFAVAAALLIGHALVPAIAALGLAWLVVLVVLDGPRARTIRIAHEGLDHTPARPAAIRRLLLTALPLGVVILLDSLTQNAQRYAVEIFHGEEALGFYAAMAWVVVVGGAFVFALGAPLAPVLARRYAAGDRRGFGRLALALAGLGAAFGVAGVGFAAAVGETFLRIAYAPEFAAHAAAFTWVMAAGALHFVLSLTLYALTAARVLRAQPIVYLLALAVTVALSVLWVPDRGLVGAAMAAVGGWAVALVVAGALAVRAWNALPRRCS
jgi:O-antigen/teichoic acid export membrane protein